MDYVLAVLREDFADLLNPSHISHQPRYGQQLVVHSKYTAATEHFDPSVASGLEFTHHDVLSSPEALASMTRKVERFRALLSDATTEAVLVYHHRLTANPERSEAYVRQRLSELTELVAERYGRPCSVMLLTQMLVSSEAERGLGFKRHGRLVTVKLRTLAAWAGNDPAHLWARHDDDLMAQAFDATQALLTHALTPNQLDVVQEAIERDARAYVETFHAALADEVAEAYAEAFVQQIHGWEPPATMAARELYRSGLVGETQWRAAALT